MSRLSRMAARDARRQMGSRKMVDPADIDNDSAEASDETVKNFVVQLRKHKSLRGRNPVVFANGEKKKIDPRDIDQFMRIFGDTRRPIDKEKLQARASKSYSNFKKVISEDFEGLEESESPFVGGDSPRTDHVDQFGNKIKTKNIAKRLARQAMRRQMELAASKKSKAQQAIKRAGVKEEVERVDEAQDKSDRIYHLRNQIARAEKKMKGTAFAHLTVDQNKLKKYKKELAALVKEEVEQVQEALPDHLKKHFDKNGNKIKGSWKDGKWTPDEKQPKVKTTVKDVTPKGYGPKEEVELDEMYKCSSCGRRHKDVNCPKCDPKISEGREHKLSKQYADDHAKASAGKYSNKQLKGIAKKWGTRGGDTFLKYMKNEEVELDEGTWLYPKTPADKQKLNALLKKPIPLGKDGETAIKAISKYIGDDVLFDDLAAASEKSRTKDARPIIKARMKQLGEEVEHITEVAVGDEVTWKVGSNSKTGKVTEISDDGYVLVGSTKIAMSDIL